VVRTAIFKQLLSKNLNTLEKMVVSYHCKVIGLLSILVVIFSIVWSSPAQVKRAYNQIPVPPNLPNHPLSAQSGRNLNGQARFMFGNFMIPNLTSWGNLFKLNGSSISFVPLGQLLFTG